MESKRLILRPIIDLEKTREKIKNYRNLKGFSVKDLQNLFGFEYPQAIYAWEQGKTVPTIDNLLILSRLYDVSLDELIVYSLKENECQCSLRIAMCMNQCDSICEKCKFKKPA